MTTRIDVEASTANGTSLTGWAIWSLPFECPRYTRIARVFHELTRMRHGLLIAIPSPSPPDPPRFDRSPHLARGWWLGADWRLGAVIFGWQFLFECR